MLVTKRNGDYESVSFDKITNRLYALINMKPLLNIDPTIISQKVCSEIYDKVKTTELDILSSEIAISLLSDNLDYGVLASRIIISNHHKNTDDNYINIINNLYEHNIINKNFYNFVIQNKDSINNILNYENDYLFDFFGFKTLEKSYLLRINEKVLERPQYLFMRVSLCIHRFNIDS